jgi:hypothetical protein
MIALFGVGAAVGLGVLQMLRDVDDIRKVRLGVLVQGGTVGIMSLANGLVLAFVGAVAFGGATAFVLAAGMSALQHALDGADRVLAFTAFHVVTRAGLSVSALVSGVASDVISPMHVFVIGTIEPPRIVLLAAAAIVVASTSMLHVDIDPGVRPRRPTTTPGRRAVDPCAPPSPD